MGEVNVEQTIKYALQQKYIEGYNDAINELRQKIAKEILLIDCPTISGMFTDPWQMFLHVRNAAVKIASDGKELKFD